jgi:predicted nuclease with TOPRIM domain
MSFMLNFCKSNMLIPLDLAVILKGFQTLQFQNTLCNKTRKRDKNSKSKSEQVIIEDMKKELANKDKKLRAQTDKIKELEHKRIPRLKENKAKLEKMQKNWSARNNLPQLLKARGIFKYKPKFFEYEDINTSPVEALTEKILEWSGKIGPKK